MGCGSGGCSTGGCGFKGVSSTGSGASGGCGSGGCSNGNCGADSWDGSYRDVAGIKIGFNARTHYFDSTGFLLLNGDPCIVESDGGEAFGSTVQGTGPSRKFSGVRDMKRVLRRARPEDIEIDGRNLHVRHEAIDYCRDKVKALNLDMKLVSADPSFDERKLTFFFTAEERVDFRELVRDLASRFRRRIEMRQIGARDEAKMVGGYGICGRPLCCSTFLTEFAPISVKMAKRQGLSLNPSKISGLCGRLMCCLRYEDVDNGEGPSPRGEDAKGSGKQRDEKPSSGPDAKGPQPPVASSAPSSSGEGSPPAAASSR